jgi:hypothetical protein
MGRLAPIVDLPAILINDAEKQSALVKRVNRSDLT